VSTLRWTSGSSGERRHGIALNSDRGKPEARLEQIEKLVGWRGSFGVLGFGRGGAVAEEFR
jgi:hypothetical protein